MGEVMSRLPVLQDSASSPLHIAERLLGEDEDSWGRKPEGRVWSTVDFNDVEVLNDETCRADG